MMTHTSSHSDTILAVDIGGTKILTCLINPSLEISEAKTWHSKSAYTHETFQAYIDEIIANYDIDQYHGNIAVGTTGVVNPDTGTLTALTPSSLGNLKELPIRSIFAKHATGNLFILNDAQAATVAEYHAMHQFPSKLAPVADMCFITVSTGVGGGIILNNKLLQGRHALVGHVGHTLMLAPAMVTPTTTAGAFGIVENYSSGTAIAKLASQALDQPMTTAEVFASTAQHDTCEQVVETAAQAIAVTIANLRVTLDISRFYLGGSVSHKTDLVQRVQRQLQRMPEQYHAEVATAYYSGYEVIIGAAIAFFKLYQDANYSAVEI